MIEQFVSDIQFEGQQYAVILRSPVQSGIISAIKLPDLPEGYTFYTAAEIPGQKMLAVFESEVPLFAEEEVSYQGQAIGILAGEDMPVLENLRNNISIEIEPVPVDSFEEKTGYFFDYPVIAKEVRSTEDTDMIFETAHSVVYSSWKTAPQYAARSEPFSAITVIQEDGLAVYVPTQWPGHVRTAVSKATGIEEERIVVYPTQIGEAFNELLWYPSLLACQCAVAAVRSNKTTVLSLSAEESLADVPKTPEILIQHRSALSEKKSIAAMHIFIIVHAGAFAPLIRKVLRQMTVTALGAYRIPHYRIEAVGLKTPQGFTDIFEGWGDSYTANALEHHIDKIILENHISPAEWRLENTVDAYTGVFSNVLHLLTTESNFSRKYAAYHVFNQTKKDAHDGRWRGIGLAIGFQHSGCAADFTYTVTMDLDVHNKLSVKAEPMSNRTRKIIRKLAASKLEIAEDDIMFTGLTTADMNDTGPATAGNTVSIVLPLVEQCLADLQDQRFRNPLPIGVSRSYRAPLAEGADTAAFISKTPAACIVELELDPVCYGVRILGIWFACSPGKIYDRKQTLSYLRKNIAAAISKTCKESLRYTDSGGVELPLSEYRMILPEETPEASVYILERETLMSAFDSIAINIVPAAYLAALNQILLSVPARIEAVPVLPQDIFNTLKGQK